MAVGDKFATLSSAVMKEAATAAMDSVEGAAGAALGGTTGGAFEFFETLGEHNDEAIAAFRLNAVEDEVSNLRNELRALVRQLAAEGKQPDRQDPMSQTVAASEFVRNISEARTVEKRTALLHATVAQFDPRKGSPAMRDYWLQQVRNLPEYELSILLLVAERGPLAFVGDETFVLGANADAERHLNDLALPPAAKQAIFTVAHHMAARQEAGRLLMQLGESSTILRNGTNYLVRPFVLGPDGQILVSFCKAD